MRLWFTCGVAEDGYLYPIWEDVAKTKVSTEGLATLNQALLMGLSSYRRVFKGRTHFSASFPLLTSNEPLPGPILGWLGGGRRGGGG